MCTKHNTAQQDGLRGWHWSCQNQPWSVKKCYNIGSSGRSDGGEGKEKKKVKT